MNKIYRNQIAGINATLPENDASRWADEGLCECYKMIDALSSTQVSQADNIILQLMSGKALVLWRSLIWLVKNCAY